MSPRALALSCLAVALCAIASCGEPSDDIAFGAFQCGGGPSEAVGIALLEVYEAPSNGRCSLCWQGGCKSLESVCGCGASQEPTDTTIRALFDGLQIRTRKVDSVCVRVVGYRGVSPVEGSCACRSIDDIDARSCSESVEGFKPGDGPLVLRTSCAFGSPGSEFDRCLAPTF